MIENQIINKVLHSKSMDILLNNRLDSSMFLAENDKAEFIFNHYRQYRVVPDVVTFLTNFSDFDVFEVAESDQYLVDKLRETNLYSKIVPVIKTMADKVRENSFEAVDYIKTEVGRIVREVAIARGQGYDIVKSSRDRLQEFQRRTQTNGLLGITTGIDILDRILHGWVKEDLVVIFARTNEGKSWLLLYFLVVAWRYGYKVLLYSGEMSNFLVGFRFDTLNEHFNNMSLMSGSSELGDSDNEDVGHRVIGDYIRYIESLETQQSFIVVTQKDFGSKKPTVDEIKHLAQMYEADVIGIDQISLMSDQRKGKEKRIQFTNISEDLYTMSEDLGVPVLAVAQASRESVKAKKKENETPELHEISESDGVAQNSTRSISMKVIDKVMRISVKKNRYGVNNRDVLMLWDTNLGILKPILESETAEEAQAEYGF